MNKHLLLRFIFVVSICCCFSKLEAQYYIGYPLYAGMFRLKNKCQTRVYYYFQDTVYRFDSRFTVSPFDSISNCFGNPEMLNDLPYPYEEAQNKGVKRMQMWILPGIIDKKTCNGLYFYNCNIWNHSKDNPKVARILSIWDLGGMPGFTVPFKGFIYENGRITYLSNNTMNNNLDLLNRIRDLFDTSDGEYLGIEDDFTCNRFESIILLKYGIPVYKWSFFQKLVNKMKDIGTCKCDK